MEREKIIRQLLDLIIENFPEDWLDELEVCENKEEFLQNKSNSLFDAILDLFCISLLSGEYIYNINFVKDLDEVEVFIDTNFDDISDDVQLQQLIFDIVKSKLINYIKILIAVYRNFNTHVSSLQLYPNHEISFKKRHSITRKITSKLKIELNDKANLFYYFTEVQILDHFLNDSKDTFIKLLDYHFAISQSPTINKFRTVVIEKILFLKYKWSFRFFSQNSNSTQLQAYIIDGEVKDFTDDTNYRGSENLKLNEWSDYLENHYEENSKWKFNIQKSINGYSEKDFDILNLQQIHCLIKYYKDISSNELALSELTTKVIEKVKNIDEGIDKFIWQKALIYILNNNFSLALDKNELQSPKIHLLEEEISNFQKKYNVNNFFIEKKLLKIKLDNINNSFEKRRILENLDVENSELKKLAKSIESCENQIKWSNSHHSLIFQLPFEESLVPSNIQELPYVYYPSSFVLPMAMTRIINEFEEIKKSHLRMNLLVEGLKSLKLEFKEINNIKNDLNKNDLKSIETISVFTAIIVFVMSVVPSLKWINSIEEAIYSYIVLASALCSMILIPLLMRRGFKEIARSWMILILLLGLLAISIFKFMK